MARAMLWLKDIYDHFVSDFFKECNYDVLVSKCFLHILLLRRCSGPQPRRRKMLGSQISSQISINCFEYAQSLYSLTFFTCIVLVMCSYQNLVAARLDRLASYQSLLVCCQWDSRTEPH